MTISPVLSQQDEYSRAGEAAEFIRKKTALQPKIGIVLGSGLGGFAGELDEATVIPYAQVPHFPLSSAQGHAGNLVIGKVGAIAVAVMQGRAHYYEGHGMQRITFPIRVFSRL